MGTFWLRPSFCWQNFPLSKAFRLDSTCPAKASCNSNTLKMRLLLNGNFIFMTFGNKFSIQISMVINTWQSLSPNPALAKACMVVIHIWF